MNQRSLPSPKATILDHGLKPKKSFGQNFMVDQRINVVFANAVKSFGDNKPVLEIGAGTGSLTSHLLAASPLVHAVERDRDLIPLLKQTFAIDLQEGRLILHEADGARFAITSVFSADNKGVLVGNLPYHLTSSIVLLALNHAALLEGAVFLVQKEVADRLAADPNCKTYGFLTVLLKLAFDVRKVTNVDRSAFWPVPKVDSAIIQLITKDHGLSQITDIGPFIVFVREIFQKRRKKVSTIFSGRLDKAQLIAAGIDPDVRPENLTPQQFLKAYLVGLT